MRAHLIRPGMVFTSRNHLDPDVANHVDAACDLIVAVKLDTNKTVMYINVLRTHVHYDEGMCWSAHRFLTYRRGIDSRMYAPEFWYKTC